MKRFFYFVIVILGFSALVGTHTSCRKDVFDVDVYDTLIRIASPVDSVDYTHNWELSTQKYIIVTANAGVNTKKVQILTGNPFTSSDAYVISQLDMAEGDRVGLSISYPSLLTTLYAAAIDAAGTYTLVKFNPSDRDVDFSSPLVKQQVLSALPTPQYYAFGYEQEYPEPGDYDYNDVVMHIALERANPREMYFHVRLAAVGGEIPLAGFLCLPEIDYEDIDTAYTVNGESFNKNITEQYMQVIKLNDLLVQGLKGEPILNIFLDAHWATGDIIDADYGIVKRKKYNVTKKSDDKSQLMVPKEVTYVLRFKTDIRANSITLDNIDPFIMRLYNGAQMEVHTFKFRESTALEEYKYIDVGHLPWAMKVPEGSFCHPLHGVNMGFRMKDANGMGILFGAYAWAGHAFGEWAMDKNKSTDWYHYPDKTYVFEW